MDTASTLDSGDSLRLREEPELDVSSSLSSSRALLVPIDGWSPSLLEPILMTDPG